MSLSCPPKLTWLLKSQLDQNSIMICHKFNGGFKKHINFEETQGRHVALLGYKSQTM
jgi:hypothetical protein